MVEPFAHAERSNYTEQWDRLVRGEQIAHSEDFDDLDEAIAKRLFAAARTQPPAGASARLHQAIRTHQSTVQNGKDSPMNLVIQVPGTPLTQAPTRSPHMHEGRSAGWQRAVSWVGAAALLLALLGSAFFALRPDPRAIMPPIQSDATPEASPSADVPMYKGNPARTGVNPGPAPQGNPVILWTAPLGSAIRSSPAVVGDSVFVGTDAGLIVAVDRTTGTERWRFTASSQVNSSPAVVDGMLYAGSEAGILYALDAATGTEVWSSTSAVPNAGPVVDGGVVYMGSVDGNVYALDAKSGTEIWRSPLGAEASKSPALADGRLFVGDTSSNVHALDAATGAPLWTFSPVDGTPVVSNGVLYMSGASSETEFTTFAIEAASGREIWRSVTADGPAPPAASDDALYFPSYGSRFYAVDPASGIELWSIPTRGFNNAPPTLVGDAVIFGSHDRSVRSVDIQNGTLLWEIELDGEIQFGPAVTGSVAFVGTLSGTLYAIGGGGPEPVAESAASPTTSATSSPIAAAPIAARLVWETSGADRSFVPTASAVAVDGTVYAVDYDNQRIGIFGADGAFQQWWGGLGVGPGQFHFADANGFWGGISIDGDGLIYVFDSLNNRVQVFSPDRTFLREWGTFGVENGQFHTPMGSANNSLGIVYVADVFNHRIQVFDDNGNYLDKWGGLGAEDGQFNRPVDIAMGRDGLLYVIEEEGHRIQVFDATGRYIRSIGNGAGSGPGQFDKSYGVAIDAENRIFLSDFDNNRIQVFSADGTLIGIIDQVDGFGTFTEPNLIVFDDAGFLYVSDNGGSVVKLEITFADS